MAKSLRSKKKKRLRTLRRDIAKPFYDKKEVAKLAAQEAALAAPKLPVPTPDDALTLPAPTNMDVEMTENNSADVGTEFKLKPTGGVKKKMKKASKLKKNKRKKGRRKNRL